MTPTDAKQLMILSAQADHLAILRDRKRITPEEYLARLNALRGQFGLPAVQRDSAA